MDKISCLLKDLEAKHDIKIIYAVEAGSRAWNLESEDSDFDIRFIYKFNNTNKYLSLKPYKETIDGFSEDRLYDWQGWDIKKALKHLKEMNPSIVEWIYSSIIYYTDPEFDFKENAHNLLKDQKRMLPLFKHYISMAKSNYKSHIEKKTNVKIKKYLYVIRPAGMVEWLFLQKKDTNKLVEIDFLVVLNDLKDFLDKNVYEDILKLIVKKKQVKELDEEPRIDKWIESLLEKQFSKEELNYLDFNNDQSFDNYDEILFSFLNIK